MRQRFSFWIVVWTISVSLTSASAGVQGQPQPDAALKIKLSTAARWFQKQPKDIGRERADFLLLLETAPVADITDLIAPALRDDAAYQGAVATFEDALDAAKDDDTRRFLRYNIARTHLLRARLLPIGTSKKVLVETAARALQPFDESNRDPGLWELKGDIETERGSTDVAISAYRKINSSGGSSAFSYYKIALVWQKARRYSEAEAVYKRALEQDAMSADGSGEIYHLIYQGLASLYIERGDFSSALNALSSSTKIKKAVTPFPFRLDAARTLLKRGYKGEVAAYLDAARKQTPTDTEVSDLLRDTNGN